MTERLNNNKSACLKLLIFLLTILIPTCDSSSPAFRLVYSAQKLNIQGDSIQPCYTTFLISNQSLVPCVVLTVASWSAYRFLRKQVRRSGISISLRIFQFVMIHIVKGFSMVNEAEVDVFLECSWFFYDPTDVGNLISGSSMFSKSIYTSGSSQFTYYWTLAWRILSITLLACEMSTIVQ